MSCYLYNFASLYDYQNKITRQIKISFVHTKNEKKKKINNGFVKK